MAPMKAMNMPNWAAAPMNRVLGLAIRVEVRARAHAHEYKAWVNAQFYAKVQIVYKTSLIAQRGPVNMAAGKKLAVIHFRAGQIGKQHTEGYRQQQQRFKLLYDGKIHQHEGNEYHYQDLRVVRYHRKASAFNKVSNSFSHFAPLSNRLQFRQAI